GGEEGGLLPAGAGPDLHDHVAVVRRVAREQQHLEVLDEARLVALQALDLLADEAAHLVVGGLLAQQARTGELVPDPPELLVGLDDGLEPGDLAPEALDRLDVARRLRQGELGVQVVVLAGDLVEPGVEAGGGGHARTARGREIRSGPFGTRVTPRGPARAVARAPAAPSRAGRARRPPRGPAPWRRWRPRSDRRSVASS